MDILSTPAEMRAWRRRCHGSLGLVPTMGYLHEGHLSLARHSRADNDLTAVSIFVNPAQFGPGEDLARYPRDEGRDLRLLGDLGVDAVYLPAPAAMYPEGYQTYVNVERVTERLEGAARPGHFRGVTTVVLKLLNAVQPDRAYFGRKDAQQLRVIRAMVRDIDLGVEIVPCDIVREPDGLAMSSRNVYLTAGQRAAAPAIYQALCEAREAFARGVRDAESLRSLVRAKIASQDEGRLEYVSLADDVTLAEIQGDVVAPALLSTVVRFGGTRLLDNTELDPL